MHSVCRVAPYLCCTQHQVLVLLLPLPNRLIQRYHERHVALIRLFQQEQLGYVVVLDLVVVPGAGGGGVRNATKFATIGNNHRTGSMGQFHRSAKLTLDSRK